MAVIKLLVCLCVVVHGALAKGSQSQVECTPEIMKVTVPMDGDRKLSYVEQLKDYKPCQPDVAHNTATFVFDLFDHSKCGLTKALNKINGIRSFYKTIVIENRDGSKETVSVRCVFNDKQRVLTRRDVQPFPLDFVEPEVLNITRYKEGTAPEPILGAVVKQNGKKVSGEISVSPGTPLSMEIFLDEASAPVYGLQVSYMHVTDTVKQQETIILNGCSVDPYLFDNFLTGDGDILSAKFRAFKFPDTSYVQFKGTVTVCLDKCQGVQCSNGVTGYGRRRRAISSGAESNKVYEVSLTTFIKVENLNGDREAEDVFAVIKNLNIANQQLATDGTPASVDETDKNRLVYNTDVPSTGNSNLSVNCALALAVSLVLTFYKSFSAVL